MFGTRIEKNEKPSDALCNDLLLEILQKISDLATLHAFALTSQRFYYAYRHLKTDIIGKCTLGTLADGGITFGDPCPFAMLAMKHNRQPRMFPQPAIRAIYHDFLWLPVDYCRSLLELAYFVGFQESREGLRNGKWPFAKDKAPGHVIGRDLEIPYPYTLGYENYLLLLIEQLPREEIWVVRRLWQESYARLVERAEDLD